VIDRALATILGCDPEDLSMFAEGRDELFDPLKISSSSVDGQFALR
jgi:hypothetical protein